MYKYYDHGFSHCDDLGLLNELMLLEDEFDPSIIEDVDFKKIFEEQRKKTIETEASRLYKIYISKKYISDIDYSEEDIREKCEIGMKCSDKFSQMYSDSLGNYTEGSYNRLWNYYFYVMTLNPLLFDFIEKIDVLCSYKGTRFYRKGGLSKDETMERVRNINDATELLASAKTLDENARGFSEPVSKLDAEFLQFIRRAYDIKQRTYGELTGLLANDIKEEATKQYKKHSIPRRYSEL